jgi:hypothetical protein
VVGIVFGCTSRKISRELVQVGQMKDINPNQLYIKAHLNNGNIYVLHSWSVNDSMQTLSGYGNYLDYNRKLLDRRGSDTTNKLSEGKSWPFTIPFEEIVIIETNDKGNNPGIAAMVVVGLATTTLSVYCVLNPKACFGSCPTYYIKKDTVEKLVGEGFSSSISKSLEEKDVDLIGLKLNEGDPIQIRVKNEALETHMIQQINIRVGEKKPGNNIFQEANGDFFEVNSIQQPSKATYRSSSILHQVSEKDELEWFSLSDSFNLAKKEEIFLEFPASNQRTGLIIDKRQSLMTTFLFYHFMSLMGQASPYYITEMETRKPWIKNKIAKMYALLGGIEVSILDQNNKWVYVNTVGEQGPIVSDSHLIILPEVHTSSIHIRLRMTQGLWRINSLNTSSIQNPVHLETIQPEQALYEGINNDAALHKLLGNKYLVTFPGEEYHLNFPISYTNKNEYFIESQGYYIEWMRDEWLIDENLKKARSVLFNPSGYLKKMAKAYKVQEPLMEKAFWDSRYTKN